MGKKQVIQKIYDEIIKYILCNINNQIRLNMLTNHE